MFFLVSVLPKPPPINGNNVAPISWKFTIFYYCIDDFSMTSQMNLLGHEICTDEWVCTVTCPGGLQTSNKIRSVWTRCLLRKEFLSLPLRTSGQCTLYTLYRLQMLLDRLNNEWPQHARGANFVPRNLSVTAFNRFNPTWPNYSPVRGYRIKQENCYHRNPMIGCDLAETF